jgi:hypothetical protein
MSVRAAPPAFPYPGHRTMAEVMRDETYDRFKRRPPSELYLSFQEWRKRA